MGQDWNYGQGQPRRPQPQGQGGAPPATPPQWGRQAPPPQDRTRPVQPRSPYGQDPRPTFTPGYRWEQPPPPGQYQYAPPQPGWQQQYPPAQYAPGPPPRRGRHTARNVIAGISGLIAVIIVISVAANSGAHSVQTAGSTGGTTAHGGSAPKTAGVGAAITLTGDSSGEQMSVTVTKVITSARAADEFNTAPAGDRLYAVQFRLHDTGSAAYSDAPSNGAVVIDSAGQSYDSSLDSAADCQSFSATENIAPGSSGLGCIVFEVPEKAKITAVQFTLDSGMGPDTGQWDVG